MPKAIQAVVFDLDGLMFNTEDVYQAVGRQLLARRGKSLTPELLDAMMGRPGRVSLQLMIDCHGLDATVAELLAETDALLPSMLDGYLAPMPGLVDLLSHLEESAVPKAVATSSRRRYTLGLLQRFEWTERFCHVLTAEDVHHGKPDPEIYVLAASRLGVPPQRMMVLEDSQIGCQAAVAAGAIAVAVPAGRSLAHDFHGARLVASSLADPAIYRLLAGE